MHSADAEVRWSGVYPNRACSLEVYGVPHGVLPLQGLIQSAFLWGYTATQLLGGSLADKYGGRAVIAFGEQQGTTNHSSMVLLSQPKRLHS